MKLNRIERWAGLLALCLGPVGLAGCAVDSGHETELGVRTQAATNCGYTITTKVGKSTKKGFKTKLKVKNLVQIPSTGLTVFVSAGEAELVHVAHGTFEQVEGGYLLHTIPLAESLDEMEDTDADVLAGKAYRFNLKFEGEYTELEAHIVSSSGVNCDLTAPTLQLTASEDFFTENGTLTLSADATDDVALSKVVFAQDGVTIATDQTAPFTLALPITSAQNGRRHYTATAYDLTGNQASETVRALVAIDNQFFGTATTTAADYADIPAHFDQLTPGNAGKWGSVEATRDQMNWTELDIAYDYALEAGVRFKLHTLVWGQQQPAWMAGLSTEEQRAEIEEWMSALAERYPNLELIDVVNEPLHAPPSYAAALGGAGETGWDWVVTSFELARQYFPNAELLLNDYAILTMASTTADYLEIVAVLSDRGLIDGIGEQGHFYERAPDLSVLENNLHALAETGLPLYITELDLNFADDARQANRMRDVFSIFSSNPSVIGITHWGHLQGSMWQTDAYLIRTDGSLRPALTWIECYRAGGTDCPVPEIVPVPHTGDASGITLEAEQYDAAHDLLPAGNVVAYANHGSWFSFDRVVFNANWDALAVTYAHGGGSPISLSIHLGSLESAAVATVPLAPTGGWSTMQTVSIPWAPQNVEDDLFVVFNGGGANVDKLAFVAPTGTGTNIVGNGTFEAGTSGWYTYGGATVSASSARFHGGSKSLLVANRTGNLPAITDLTSVVETGQSYPLSLWVSVQSTDGSAKSINVTQATSCRAADGTVGTTYAWIVNPTSVPGGTPAGWVQLAGTVIVPTCDLVQLQLFVEGGAGADLYVDDVQVIDNSGASSNLITDGTFESGQGAWGGWGYATLGRVSTSAHAGTYSLQGTGMNFGAISRDIRALVTPAKRYQASAWVSVANLPAGSGQVKFQTVQACNGTGDSYPWLAGVTATNGNWIQVTGTVDLTTCSTIEKLILFVGADSGDLLVDDVTLTPLP
jgi:endo-1,4-beta-xylanase